MAYVVDRTSPLVLGTRGDDNITGGAPGQILVGGPGSDRINPGLNFTRQRLYGNDGPDGQLGGANDRGVDVAALGENDVAVDFEFYELHGLDYRVSARIDHFRLGKSHVVMPLDEDAFVFDFGAKNWRVEDGKMHADVYRIHIKTPNTPAFREGDGVGVIVNLAKTYEISFDSPREKMAELADLMHDVLL